MFFVKKTKEEKQPQQISFEDLLGDSYKEPEFVKVDDVPAEVQKVPDIVFEKVETPVVEVEAEEKTASEINASSIRSKSIQKLFWGSIFQIGILDIVFSLDSVITAVGLVDEISIMVAAVLISVIFMLWAAKPIGDFVHHHPSIKVLALSFLMIVGFVLIAESLDVHIPKGYVYFAMAFSLGVEVLNIRARQKKGG